MGNAAKVYNIPAIQPFGRTLAAGLLDLRDRDPLEFSKALILLPTRRACRTLREAFLKLTNGQPLLLPRIQPLGEVDEEELSLWLYANDDAEEFASLPPAISPLRRKLLLSRLIQAQEGVNIPQRQALLLADALGAFIDQLIIEELEFNRLHEIVPEEFANHWQITLDFLKIISEYWPQILAEHGVIEAADRRARLMDMLGRYWTENPPSHPVIAGGSTGSHPATARFMARISHLPKGQVVLPGLDTNMDQESWNAIEASHPQYGLKQLLSAIGLERKDVQYWQDPKTNGNQYWRALLATELMRPAQTSAMWQTLPTRYKATDLATSINALRLATCKTPQTEAMTIALALRKTLEEPFKTAILVTPDRNLARRVSALCSRWNIAIDDSSGQPLSKTPAGLFLRLISECITEHFRPVPLLGLLKHPYTRMGLDHRIKMNALRKLESALRGLSPAEGLDGLIKHLQRHEVYKNETEIFVNRFSSLCEPLMNHIKNNEKSNIYDILTLVVHFVEALFEPQNKEAEPSFWQGEDGEALATLLINLQQEASALEPHSLLEFLEIFLTLCDGVPVRPKFGSHPRLSILGQLEARMVDADLVILGALNEGVWPSDPGHDPWMSRPMRAEFGLPPSERTIGLAAHDFVQAFSNSAVLITRSEISDGTPTIPSRWLSRLKTVLDSIDETFFGAIQEQELTAIANHMDNAEAITPITRPMPIPLPQHKPKRLSVTQIETLLKDPYAIYANKILKLQKLDPLEKSVDAAERGTLLHAILERFTRENMDHLPDNISKTLKDIAEYELENFNDSEDFQNYWRARFDTIARWLERHESDWRKIASPKILEAKGELNITIDEQTTFTLSGIADRIDTMKDGSGLTIIDYKSGGTYNKKSMRNGDKPQLLLEALMVEKGAFSALGPSQINQLSYWKLSGGNNAGDITTFNHEDDLSTAIEETQENLLTLLRTFITDIHTPYICQPRNHLIPAFDDYEHLSRKAEWTAESESEEIA